MLHKSMMRSFQPCPLNKYSLLKGSDIDNHIYAMVKQCYLMLSGSNSKPFLVTSDLKRSSGLQLNNQYPHCMHSYGSTHMTSTDTQNLPWLSLLHTSPSTEGLTTTTHVKDVASPEMFPRISTEKTAVC